jgi:hypothetical protein
MYIYKKMRVNNRGAVDTLEYPQMLTNMHASDEHGISSFW